MKHLKFVLRFVRKYKMRIFLGLCIILLYPLLTIRIPMMMKDMIDITIPSKDLVHINMAMWSMIILFVISRILKYAEDRIFAEVNLHMVRDIRIALFSHIVKSGVEDTSNYTKGDLITRVEEDIKSIVVLFVDEIARCMQNLVVLVMNVFMMFMLSKELVVLVIFMMVVYIAIVSIFNSRLENYYMKYVKTLTFSKDMLVQLIDGLDFLKINRMSNFAADRYSDTANEKCLANEKKMYCKLAGSSLTATISGVVPYFILGIGGSMTVLSDFTIGEIIAFNTYLTASIVPLSAIANYLFNISQAKVSSDRMDEILDLELVSQEVESSELDMILQNADYKVGDKHILKNTSISINKGEKVAIIGHSGSGKSTLAKVLTGQLGYDSNTDKSGFRKFTGQYICAEPFVYSGNLLENILCGKPLDQRKLEEVVRISRIDRLGYGFDSLVSNWSHGEKQKVSLARALYANEGVLVIDEGLSNIDRKELVIILKELIEIEGLTMIFITHIVELTELFDRIVEMKSGRAREKQIKRNGLA